MTTTLSTPIYDILPDVDSYINDLAIDFDSLGQLQQAKVLTDVLLDFGTFSPDCDAEAVAYAAALRHVGLTH